MTGEGRPDEGGVAPPTPMVTPGGDKGPGKEGDGAKALALPGNEAGTGDAAIVPPQETSQARRGEKPASQAAGEGDEKVPPQSVQFRGKPPRAIRFDRRILIGATTIVLCGVAATAWWALGRGGGMVTLKPADQAIGAARAPDALAALPETYGAVPQLGPPLPGDLGRPILRKQEQMLANPDAGREKEEARRRAQAAQDKAQALLDAARTSGLMVNSGRAAAREPDIVPVDLTARPEGGIPAQGGTLSMRDEGVDPSTPVLAEAAAKAGFLKGATADPGLNGHPIVPPASATILASGSVIAASLLTGIDSDLPGLVTAQVTHGVHDSATGRHLLIPQGARLIGRYENAIGYGQSRLLLVWQRLIFPDGRSVALENMPATDGAGHAGLTDKVDAHADRLAGGILLSSLLSLGANLSIGGESDLVRAVRESSQQNVMRAGDRLTQRNLEVSPTIRIRPGTPVNLLVHQDLLLPIWTAKE